VNTIDAVKQTLLRSGASWVLWFLGALSLVSVAIIVERWLFYRQRRCDVAGMARRLGTHLARGDLQAALAELASSSSVAAAVAAAGLRLADRGPAPAERAMQSAAALERVRLERWLAYLGTLGNNAPFIGLFGTVLGIIRAFADLAAHPAAAAGASTVMTGISEALVATAVGLFVAIPAVLAYNIYQRLLKRVVGRSQSLGNAIAAGMHVAHGSGRGA